MRLSNEVLARWCVAAAEWGEGAVWLLYCLEMKTLEACELLRLSPGESRRRVGKALAYGQAWLAGGRVMAPHDWLQEWQEQADEWQREIEERRRREVPTDDEEHQDNGDDPRQTDELADDIPF